jgi:hypothetical protein
MIAFVKGFVEAVMVGFCSPFIITAFLAGLLYEASKQSFLWGRLTVLQLLRGMFYETPSN